MIAYLLACAAGAVPSLALFFWLRNGVKKDAAYSGLCTRALFRGAGCILPVFLLSGCSFILLRLTGLHRISPLAYQALYTFIVLALMEETAKYRAFRYILKTTDAACSWMDAAVLMTIVGLGFGILESLVYAIDSGIPVMLVRGICVAHGGYGFLTGWFYGKGSAGGSRLTKAAGFVIAWAMHGLYDFALSEEFLALNDNTAFVAVLLALTDIVLVFLLIGFVRRAKRQPRYTQALPDAPGRSGAGEEAGN